MPSKREEVVYICAPYRAPKMYQIVHNIEVARRAAEKFLLRGYTVICPHLNTAIMDGLLEDEEFLKVAMVLLRRSDIIYACGKWDSSSGCSNEIDEAIKLYKRIIYEGEVI